MKDLINNPPHYNIPNIDSLDGKEFSTDVLSILAALDEKITDEEGSALTGLELHMLYSAIAYIFRAPFKGTFIDDLQKAIFYLKKISDE